MGNTTSNNGDVSGHGRADIWLVNINRNGDILWSKTLGGTGQEGAGNVRQNKDGTLYLMGSTSSNDGDVSGNHPNYIWKTTSTDIWVVKLTQQVQSYGNVVLAEAIRIFNMTSVKLSTVDF